MFTTIISGIVGAVLMTAFILFVMRKYMIRAYKIDAPFEAACDNIETAVKSVDGWVHPMPDWDFHAAVSKSHFFNNLAKKRIFFICKAKYANRIVDKYHHMGAMMPCAWAIYETQKGEVYLSKMNIALMSKVFFGNIIGSTMAKVAREEQQMMKKLQELLKQEKRNQNNHRKGKEHQNASV